MPSVSLLVTVYNEAHTLEALVASIASQTRIPDETIIVDGGSTDSTVKLLKQLKKRYPAITLRSFVHTSNRSGGRNYAISKAKYNWLACTDAGCVLDSHWLEELVKKQLQTKADAVAGYYKAVEGTPLEEAITPYVLVMPDKVDSFTFLPSTRSVLFSKASVLAVGGFDQSLELSEDYALAKKLKKSGATIQFAPHAVVSWQPRTTVASFYTMVRGMSEWDVRAGILRIKAVLVVCRYVVVVCLLYFVAAFSIFAAVVAAMVAIISYAMWAVKKNMRYVPRGYRYLPLLQVVADIGVMHGLFVGWYLRFRETIGKFFLAKQEK